MATQSKSAKVWKARIEACRRERKKREEVWKTNVAYRKGKPFVAESEQDRIAVPIDWSFTKAKIAQLFSQVPQVQLTPKNPAYAPAVPVFAKELNDLLQNEARVAVAMEEVLSDVINAAGIGAVKVGYSATFEEVEVLAVDPVALPPEAQLLLAAGELQLPTEVVKRPVSERFYVNRISPAALLWPVDFKGSDFDDAPWIGWEGTLTWAQAKREFGLPDSVKEDVLGSNTRELSLNEEDERERLDEARLVRFQEIFYKAAEYDADVLHFDRLRRIVFVEGIEEPVIHEDLEWQRYDETTGQYVGVCKFPIRVLTLTYLSDEAIPPSDSEMGRPQVDETMRSRSQMIAQRDRSMPIRWYDVNRIDPMVADNLQRGVWQGFIPTSGDGARAIGEVARAVYPAEDWTFDRVTRSDLMEAWQVGPNQLGMPNSGERSASEANIIQANFSTRIGFERAKVAKFFVGIAETLAGLMQLYYDPAERARVVGDEAVQRSDQVWNRSLIAGAKFVFSIRPDSTVLLDAASRVDQLFRFFDLTGKSGFVNVEPIIAEMAALMGLDPAEVMVKPQPPQPEPPNFSVRVSGEDLSNPVVIALIQKQQNISPDEIAAAKALIADAQSPLPPGSQLTGPGVPIEGEQVPLPNPDWTAMPRITKRSDEG